MAETPSQLVKAKQTGTVLRLSGISRALTLVPVKRRHSQWMKDLKEYRRLLAIQITQGSRETPSQMRAFYKRQARINQLYRRLY